MGSVGPVVLLVALVDGKNVATAQQKVCAPSYGVDGVVVGANAGVTWRFGRVAALTVRRGAAWGATRCHWGRPACQLASAELALFVAPFFLLSICFFLCFPSRNKISPRCQRKQLTRLGILNCSVQMKLNK